MNSQGVMLNIKRLLRTLGVPVNLAGYEYIAESINFMLNTKKILSMSEIYEKVSKIYNVNTESVEVSIRHAVKKSVSYNNNIRQILGIHEKQAISNSIFLSTVKEFVREEYYLSKK
ncbi:MAG: hypothetical protein IJC57_04660 [Clostridia bacterium]|nr:hypothetical protein [Clostridia bacterium]MBQ3093521.1 hypothetical protein [Clostridia bacterium]